jgi:hypothetical protein
LHRQKVREQSSDRGRLGILWSWVQRQQNFVKTRFEETDKKIDEKFEELEKKIGEIEGMMKEVLAMMNKASQV